MTVISLNNDKTLTMSNRGFISASMGIDMKGVNCWRTMIQPDLSDPHRFGPTLKFSIQGNIHLHLLLLYHKDIRVRVKQIKLGLRLG